MTWRVVARLTHLSAKAQQRLWRVLIIGAGVGLLGCWAGLSAMTRAAEKGLEEASQSYQAVAPLAAEVMDLRERSGRFDNVPPVQAVEQVLRAAGIGPERMRLRPQPALQGPEALEVQALGLSLRELAEVLRDLRLQTGLTTVSATLTAVPGPARRVNLGMTLVREHGDPASGREGPTP